jgi:hypothetical protein
MSETEELELSREIRRLSGDVYQRARQEVEEAEDMGDIALSQVWMRGIRNGSDHLSVAVTRFFDGNYVGAKVALQDSERMFQVAIEEAWKLAASRLTRRLEDRLHSMRISGPIDVAYGKLHTATRLLTESRIEYSTDRENAILKAKRSAKEAFDGLNTIQVGSRLDNSMLVLTAGSVIVAILALVAFLLKL